MKRYDPAELDALLHDPVPVAPRRERLEPSPSSDRPGDAFNATFSQTDVLGWLEFEFSHSDNQGEHWVRPGKSARDGASVTIYEDPDGPKAVVWSDTVTGWYPALEVRRPYDAWGLFVCTHFEGNFGSANAALAAEGFGEPRKASEAFAEQNAFVEAIREDIHRVVEEETHTTWWPITGQALLAGNPDPPPDLFEREDGVFLLYRGRVNAFVGEPESAKSWGAQAAAVECIQHGGSVLMIDCENSLNSVAERMLALGLSEYEFARSFAYMRPDEIMTRDTHAHADFVRTIETGYDLIIVDGITDCMAMLALDPLDNKDAGTFDRFLLKPMAATGAAVLAIDHMVKAREGRGAWAIGSQHKKAAITGGQYIFEKVHDFGRGMKGMSRVVVAKDKAGYVRQHQVGDKLIAEFWLDGTVEGKVTWELLIPTEQSLLVQANPRLMELICNYISANTGERKATVLISCSSSATPAQLAAAFDKLRARGHIVNDLADKNCWRTVVPFHEAGSQTAVIAGMEEEIVREKAAPSTNGKASGWTV